MKKLLVTKLFYLLIGTSVNGKEVTKRSATNELENYPGKKPKILFLLGEYESSDGNISAILYKKVCS